MATIATIKSGKSIRYKAIIKSGGKILKCKTFTKKSMARQWAKRMEADKESLFALGLPGQKITLKELAKDYKDGNTRLDWFVKKLGPTKSITEITTEDMRSVLDEFGAGKALSRNPGQTRSPATFNRARALMSGMFKFAIQKGYLSANPVKPIPSKPENNKIVRYLSDDERDRLLQAVREQPWDRFEMLIIMALTTGARRGELMNLRWQDIDFENAIARLHTSKNGEPRNMPLTMPALTALKQFRGVGSGLVFPGQIKPWTSFEFGNQWKNALKQAGINNFRFHDLSYPNLNKIQTFFKDT